MEIGNLTKSPNGDWVTFKEGKRLIRGLCKVAGLKTVGTFRPRSVNRSEFSLPVEGGFVTAPRKVGASVVFVRS
jgi:hypothetical protein